MSSEKKNIWFLQWKIAIQNSESENYFAEIFLFVCGDDMTLFVGSLWGFFEF